MAPAPDAPQALYHTVWQDAPETGAADLRGGWLVWHDEATDVSPVLRALEEGGATARLVVCADLAQWREALAAAADLPEPRRLLAIRGDQPPAPTDGMAAQRILEECYLQQLAPQDVELMIRAADLTLRADLDRVLDEIARTLSPLRGVIHSAVWSGDGFETLAPEERMRRVFAPKVAGGWNLHQATHHLELDFFLLFS